jgi:type VI protein secretion system component VasF
MWNRRGIHRWSRSLEAALRDKRPEAPATLVEAISESLSSSRRRTPALWSRVAFAAALAVFILGTFASLGGVSYARPGAVGTYEAVKQIVVVHKLKVSVPTSSAASQYPKKPTKKPVFTPPKVHHGKTGAVAAQTGTLPFTGISLLGTLLLSLALIGAGIVLRRRERRS